MKIFIDKPLFGGVNSLRQTPLYSGAIQNSFASPIPGTDYDFYYIREPNKYYSWIPKKKRIWIMMENPKIWKPSREFLDWYGYIVTPFPLENGDYKQIKSHPSVPWFYGVKYQTDRGVLHIPSSDDVLSFEDIVRSNPPKKKLLSIISSTKVFTPGHKWRFSLAKRLKELLTDNVDIFGFGHTPISDKREALDPYKFTIVIENHEHDNYWTEKLSDALLAGCIPLYSGAPNISEYFSHEIPQFNYMSDLDIALRQILYLLESSAITYPTCQWKDEILNRHNLYSHLPSLFS